MNVEGSYTCNCEAGFVFIPDSGCQDVNECAAGGEIAISCLVTQQLGLCNNTAGGYHCICLSGAYTTSPRECKACQCDAGGVTTSHCDGNTGECLCKEKVIGQDCSACADKYTNFPYCNKCAPGHYIIGLNYHGHYFHAGGLSVNNYVRENIVREVNVR